MNKKTWYTLWGAVYIICAALGFAYEPTGLLKAIFVVLALAFFVPPAVLLYNAAKNGDKRELRRIRNLSILSLTATLVLMIVNILCAVNGSEALGQTLYALLVLVSSPMYCAQNGLVSLFLWACLLMAAIHSLRKKNTVTK